VAIVYVFFKGKEKISTQDVQEKLFEADSARIDKIEISKKEGSVTIEKINGQWQVTKPITYPADTNAITPILSNLMRFRVESIISTNPEKFPNYLDSANNTQVTVFQEGKELGSFVLGKYAVSYDNTYIKIPGEEKIFLAANLTSANFNKALKDFRNKHIFSIPILSMNKIEFKSIDSNMVDYACLRDSATNRWFIGNDSISQPYIDGFLNLMSNFSTDDFMDSVITEFPAPTWTINIYGMPQPMSLNLYKQGSGSSVYYILQTSNNRQLFKFSEPMAAQLLKKKSDFIPPPPKPIETGDKKKK
jgi:hypothetical protein